MLTANRTASERGMLLEGTGREWYHNGGSALAGQAAASSLAMASAQEASPWGSILAETTQLPPARTSGPRRFHIHGMRVTRRFGHPGSPEVRFLESRVDKRPRNALSGVHPCYSRQFARKGLTICRPAKSLSFSVTTTQSFASATARPADVLALVVRRGMRLTLFGVAIGVVAALAVTRLAASLLVHVSATDPLVFAAASLFLAAVALAANHLPARRATRIDPNEALRCAVWRRRGARPGSWVLVLHPPARPLGDAHRSERGVARRGGVGARWRLRRLG